MTGAAETTTVRKGDLDVLVAACTAYLPPDLPPEAHEAFKRLLNAFDGAHAEPAQSAPDGDGQWLSIAFMGHVELTGYVTEISIGGQSAFHIDLPGKLWGGNPLAWEEYSASALYSRRPVTEESVRKAWEAQLERARRRAGQEAEWERSREQRALEAGDGNYDEEPVF